MPSFVLLFLFFGSCLGGEWLTTRGEHCIDKCKYRGEKNYFYWCHTSDPKMYYTSGSDVWDYSSPDNELKWDFCTPSEDEHGQPFGAETATPEPSREKRQNNWWGTSTEKTIAADSREEEKEPQNWWDVETTTTPGPRRKPTFSPNAREEKPDWNDGSPKTALYPQTACSGPCRQSGQRTICSTKTDHPSAEGPPGDRWFYCVNDVPLRKEQITAKHQLWCIDPCRREGKSHYWCNTLYGPDHCSPDPLRGSQGRQCKYPCERYESTFNDYFFCYTDATNDTWEYCGNFNVPEEKKTLLEFTDDEAVCADYCRESEDKTYQYCYYVYWQYNDTLNRAELMKSWDYCRGFAAPPMEWSTILIIVICIIAAIGVCIGLAAWCSKSDYMRASTG